MVSDSLDAVEQSFTINRLKRWSCSNAFLPQIQDIRELHVYDFDNTMFKTAMPNASLWDVSSIGKLMDASTLASGGWFHHPAILSATGQGLEIEEPKAWSGHWNENIVDLIRMSMEQKDAMTVLLTGRAEGAFADIIQRICKSKNLEFDMYGLKPVIGPDNRPFKSTMAFKQEFLKTLMRTYAFAEELRIYEDRLAHVNGFRDFFTRFNNDIKNKKIQRSHIQAEVIEVTDLGSSLDPVVEAATVQTLVNAHNEVVRSQKTSRYRPMIIHKKCVYTAYQIRSAEDTQKLINLVSLPKGAKRLANSVLITTYVASDAVLQMAGGLGKVVRFEVAAIGLKENRVWAAQLKSVATNAYTSLPRLQVIIALNDGARPSEARDIKNWHPIHGENVIQFDAVVSEVFRLSLQEEVPPDFSLAPSHGPSIIPQKRRNDHFKNDQESSHWSPPAKRGNGAKSRGQRGNGEPRGGIRRGSQQIPRGGAAPRGGQSARGGGSNNRGRGSRGNRDVSNRRGGYHDHDAAAGAKPGNEQNMHNDY